VSVNRSLSEGTARKDCRTPPFTVVGHNHARRRATAHIAMYQTIERQSSDVSIRRPRWSRHQHTWHALKIAVTTRKSASLQAALNATAMM